MYTVHLVRLQASTFLNATLVGSSTDLMSQGANAVDRFAVLRFRCFVANARLQPDIADSVLEAVRVLSCSLIVSKMQEGTGAKRGGQTRGRKASGNSFDPVLVPTIRCNAHLLGRNRNCYMLECLHLHTLPCGLKLPTSGDVLGDRVRFQTAPEPP